MPAVDQYSTEYSRDKNINTLDKGSYNDYGDGTPAKQVNVDKFNPFTPPKDSDTITAEYPSNTVEIYRYRQGGLTGTILNSITVTYATSSKRDLVSVELS